MPYNAHLLLFLSSSVLYRSRQFPEIASILPQIRYHYRFLLALRNRYKNALILYAVSAFSIVRPQSLYQNQLLVPRNAAPPFLLNCGFENTRFCFSAPGACSHQQAHVNIINYTVARHRFCEVIARYYPTQIRQSLLARTVFLPPLPLLQPCKMLQIPEMAQPDRL